MDNVLIIGGEGQLGRCLAEQLAGSYLPLTLDRAEYDLTHPEDLRRFLSERNYRAVVNCAAYTAVDQAESEESLAFEINSDAVGSIAAQCEEFRVPLIHISTDYVYDNGLTRPLIESDPVHPRSVYARSKLAGERAALIACKRTFILRTSWVFSEYGTNFVLTMLRLAENGVHPKVVSDQYGSPTYARDLANAIREVIGKIEATVPGVYNFCNSGATTWDNFAGKIYEIKGLRVDVTPITTAEYGAAASRPHYSVLDTTKFSKALKMQPRPWHNALSECIARLSERP